MFFGLLLMLTTPDANGLIYVGAALMIGAGLGMLFGIVRYSLNRARREYTSVTQLVAGTYQVIVDGALTLRAQELLGLGSAARRPEVASEAQTNESSETVTEAAAETSPDIGSDTKHPVGQEKSETD